MELPEPSSCDPWSPSKAENLKPLKRRRAGEWVVTMATKEMDDVDHLPVLDGDSDVQVVCLSQVSRKLSDAAVGTRDCLLADSDGTRPWKGSLLQDFMTKVAAELETKVAAELETCSQSLQALEIEVEAKSLMQEQVVCVVVYEAYKVLEKDFTAIMQSTLGLSEHQKFVKRFRNAIARAAKLHAWSYSPSGSWIHQNVPFGIFVEGIRLLLDAQCSTENGKLKVKALREEAMKLFEEILEAGLESLQEESESCGMLSPTVTETLEFLRESVNTEAVVREFSTCAKLRHGRNGYSHPFSPIASKAVRDSARALYSSLLRSDYTKDFRHIAVMGKVKLDILEFLKKEKKVDMEDDGELLLESDSCSDSLERDSSPKASGLWEDEVLE